MEAVTPLVAWGSVGAGLALLMLIVAIVVRKFKTKKEDGSSSVAVKWKDFPMFKYIPIKMQFSDAKKETETVDRNFSQLLDYRRRDNPLPDLAANDLVSNLNKRHNEGTNSFGKESLEDPKQLTAELIKKAISVTVGLVWASNDRSLTVMILDVSDFPAVPTQLFFHLRLDNSSKITKHELNFEGKKEYNFNQSLAFYFTGLSLEDVHHCHLRINLWEKKSQTSKTSLLAKGALALRDLVLIPNKPLDLTFQLPFVENPEIPVSVCLVWATNDRSLTVMILDVRDLVEVPAQLFFHLSLQSTKNTRNVTAFDEKKEYNLHTSLAFYFKGITQKDIHYSRLKMELTEKKSRFSKESPLARGTISFKDILLVPNKPLDLVSQLAIVEDDVGKSKKQNCGLIDLSLKCSFVGQVSAKFIISIKKAEKLPSSRVGSDYRVELFLLRNNQRFLYFSSSLKRGSSPEWNEAFAVNIMRNNIAEYSLNIVVMRITLGIGSVKVGETTLYNSETGSTFACWMDAIENLGQEIMISRELEAPNQDKSSGSGKCMGLMGITLEEKLHPTRWTKLSKFEVTINKVAHLEFEKTGGDYKAELFIKRGSENLHTFSTQTSPSTHLVWNARFTFPISIDKIDNLEVEVFLIRVGKLRQLRQDVKIGRATFGKEVFVKCQQKQDATVEEWLPITRTQT